MSCATSTHAADASAWGVGRARLILERSDYTQGCPVVMLAREAGSEPVAQATQNTFTTWHAGLSAKLAERRVPAPDATAMSILLMVQGALVLGKSMRSSAPLDQVVSVVRRRLACYPSCCPTACWHAAPVPRMRRLCRRW